MEAERVTYVGFSNCRKKAAEVRGFVLAKKVELRPCRCWVSKGNIYFIIWEGFSLVGRRC